MVSWHEYASAKGILPYAPHIMLGRWSTRVDIDTNVIGLRIPDFFSQTDLASRRYFRILPLSYGSGNKLQSYWFMNLQGLNSYESKYGGGGLLIVHAIGQVAYFDIESALGLFDTSSGQPDPVNGEDLLDALNGYVGSDGDFFDDQSQTFSSCTNPSSDMHAIVVGSPPYLDQSVPSYVSIENITTDLMTGEVVVDIFVHPEQIVVFPNGGEVISRGVPTVVGWLGPSACIPTVDIEISDDGGTEWRTIASNCPNTGQFEWMPLQVAGSQYAIRIISDDGSGGTVADTSDAVFSIEDTRACP